MQLNMWMVVNRLKQYEIKKYLNEKSNDLFSSVLPIYMQGSIWVFEKDGWLVCQGNKEKILIKGLNSSDGLMLIQSIFNWYQDWINRVNFCAFRREFDKMARIIWTAFHSPVMIQDSNYRLLGLATASGTETLLPSEWQYILQHGQSSVQGYTCMAETLRQAEHSFAENVIYFQKCGKSMIGQKGLYTSVRFQGKEFMKITVLEEETKFNSGDFFLMQYLSRHLAIYESAISNKSMDNLQDNLFDRLIQGAEVPNQDVNYLDSLIRKDQEGQYALMSLKITGKNQDENAETLQILENILTQQYPSLTIRRMRSHLVITMFMVDTMTFAEQVLQTIELYGYCDGIIAGLSLEFHDLRELYYYYEQAEYMLAEGEQELKEFGRYREQKKNKVRVLPFYDVAYKRMLEDRNYMQICDCEPRFRYIWDHNPSKRQFLETLYVYLDEERSSHRTSERLFIHKNTLTYRIKQIVGIGGWNLDDAYIRNYLRMSAIVIKKNQK